MFASAVRDTFEVKDHQGLAFSVTIGMLSGKSLKKAHEARQMEQARQMREMGGDIFKVISDEREARDLKAREEESERLNDQERADLEAEKLEAKRAAHYNKYDRQTVLVQGILSWSHPVVKLSPRAIEDIDEANSEMLFRKIIDLSDPFKTPEQSRRDLGEGSAPSTS